MTPLRQRFIDDLRLHNLAPRTIDAYVVGVAKLARFAGRSPDQLGSEDIRKFQLDLLNRKVSWSLFNQTVTALRWLFGVTLQRPQDVPAVSFGHRPRRLPVVLATDEVLCLLEGARPGRDRVLLQTTYACGLRLSELLGLKVTDIDSARMFVVVRKARGVETVWFRCRRGSWPNCGPTGGRTGPRPGCFQERRRIGPCARPRSSEW